jgi:hypothetical protein
MEYVKVMSIEPDGFEDVYNMEVDDFHNFAVNGGYIVHNCGYGIISHHLKHTPQKGVDERTEIQRHKDSLIRGNRRKKYRGHVSFGVIRR